MTRLLLINPNTSETTTSAMLAIAREACPPPVQVTGLTARFGANLICDLKQLAIAADAVIDAFEGEPVTLERDGIVVAAFGDPAVDRLRTLQSVPVVGLADASMRAASAGGRRFSIVTTTPGLEAAILRRAEDVGCSDQLASIRYTASDAITLSSNPDRLALELSAAVRTAVALDRAEAVIIGGGPLAVAARRLSQTCDVPIIEPLPSAIHQLLGGPPASK